MPATKEARLPMLMLCYSSATAHDLPGAQSAAQHARSARVMALRACTRGEATICRQRVRLQMSMMRAAPRMFATSPAY